MLEHRRLYPEILFHFTSLSSLEGILENNFSVSYSREKIIGLRKTAEFAVPMVSFCDLRLSELNSHMGKYGNYGIGLTKDWANKRGLNPVLYMSRHCPSTAAFINAVESLYAHLGGIKDGDEYSKLATSYMDILNVYRYIKNYEGELTRSDGSTTPDYRFADEREWRYVPPIAGHDLPFVPLDKVKMQGEKNALNAKLQNHRLEFEPGDIRYLIVKTDSERLALINHLDIAKSRFDQDTRRLLASRIITADQIANDI